ncbi:MAG: peptidase S41 [Bacteroidetes bacterium]|nr:MAG: peptidase S41 [Bacteroidota bacterium]
MQYKNSKFSIYTPIILALVLAGGIFLGSRLNINKNNGKINFKIEPNKIDLIIDLIESDYVDSVERTEIIENTIPHLLENLDPHSVYISAKDLQHVNEPLEGNFDGIGVQFNLLNDTILVINTISGGPSEKIGLRAGDKIILINDSLFAGVNINNQDVIKNLKGPRGTIVKVSIARAGFTELLEFEITRDEIPLYSLDVAYMITDKIGYIKISAFARTTYDEFTEAVKKLKDAGMEKIILDLRANGGGYLDAAINIADEFLKNKEMIVYTKGKSRPRSENLATNKGSLENEKVVILIDTWSASASEIVAGAIQDNDRGLIIGRRSFGKGLVQEPTMFRDGSALRLTIARYYTPSGRCIQKSYSDGNEDYNHEWIDRYENGEMENADSTVFADSLKYYTKAGKVVYGGGGIMPDIFVPIDTVGYTSYFREISQKALIYNFALDYTDKHRAQLESLTDYKLIVKHLKQKNVFNQFLKYANSKGVTSNSKEITISGKLINAQINAYIARNIIDNEGYYPIIKDIDKTLLKAIEVISGE